MRLPSNELEDLIDDVERDLLRFRTVMTDAEIRAKFRGIRSKVRLEIHSIDLDIQKVVS